MNVNEKRLKDRGGKLEDMGIPRDFIDDNMNTDFACAVMTNIPRKDGAKGVIMSQVIYPPIRDELQSLESAKQAAADLWDGYIRIVKTQMLWAKRLTGYYKRYPGKNARKLRIVRKLLNNAL